MPLIMNATPKKGKITAIIPNPPADMAPSAIKLAMRVQITPKTMLKTLFMNFMPEGPRPGLMLFIGFPPFKAA